MNKWDEKLQQFHGGQEWSSLTHFVEDFSVTTNGFGTPLRALEAARESIGTIHHYPPADQEPARSSLAKFIWEESWEEHEGRLLLGNGASELIDLVTRAATSGDWHPGPWKVQYKEYQRAAQNCGRKVLAHSDKPSAVTSIVNPSNPTGEYLNVEEMKNWIETNVGSGGVVIVDESMQPWHSSVFRSDSLTGQSAWIRKVAEERHILVYIIHSWTKLWSCTGIRLGSIVCPTRQHRDALKLVQVPWSLNSPALAFLDAVVEDKEYLEKTWTLTPKWRKWIIDQLANSHPAWKVYGKEFLSYIWIDVGSREIAIDALSLARKAGVPVRDGINGYNQPTFIRIAVRDPEKAQILIDAWKSIQ